MMNDQDYVDAIAAYVLGALDPEERAAFEARMMLDSALHTEVLRYQEVVAELPFVPSPVRPPAAVKARLLAEIRASDKQAPAVRSPTVPRATRIDGLLWSRGRFLAAAGSAVLLVIGLIVALVVVSSQLRTASETNAHLVAQVESAQHTLDDLRGAQQEVNAQLSESRQREQALAANVRATSDTLARLQQQVAANEQLVRFLSAADVAVRALAGTGEASAAQGAMYMRPGQRDAVVVLASLPPLAPGDTYQFWLAKNNASMQFNAGVVLIDAAGNGQLVLQAPAAVNDFTAMMVTVEHQQHATVPSDTRLLYGTL